MNADIGTSATTPVRRRSGHRTLTIHKFGGASLADAGAVRAAVALLTSAPDRKSQERAGDGRGTDVAPSTLVVASAFAGVTDALLTIAQTAATAVPLQLADEVTRLRDRHLEVVDRLLASACADGVRTIIRDLFAELEALIAIARLVGEVRPRELDLILARGERLSAYIVAAKMRDAGIAAVFVDATAVIATDGPFGNAAPDLRRTTIAARKVLRPMFAAGLVPVLPGFIGCDPNGDVVTLGRGGSDLAATLLARALAAETVILWKDVPGLLTADPRVVSNARVIPHLNVREASELAHYGVKVLHPRTLAPLAERTSVFLRPFGNLSASGTEISSRDREFHSPVKAVAATMDQALVSISGRGLNPLPGIAARAFSALNLAGLGAALISQAASEYAVTFTIPNGHVGKTIAALRETFTVELARREIEIIDSRIGVATIGVVGRGLAHQAGVAGRVFGALAAARINVVAAAQGSGSGGSLSIVVDATRAVEAQCVIHEQFELHKAGGGRVAPMAHADVILLGVGAIGRELLGQIAEPGTTSIAPLRVCGLIDSSGFIFDARGLSDRRLAALSAYKAGGGSLADAPGGETATAIGAVDVMSEHALSCPILVDATAADTAAVLDLALDNNWDLVLANKVPLAADRDDVQRLERNAQTHGRHILHEATVGAGLPVIDTLRKLIEAGDSVLRIEGCPSGTLGYLFGELGHGRSFATALRGAIELGYTEPDPRIDLSGIDVARKALILGRLIGFDGDLSDVTVESLVPEMLRDVPHCEFVRRLEELDEAWSDRVQDARVHGKVLRYRARITQSAVAVGLVAVTTSDPLGTLNGTDNQFSFTTRRYKQQPLVITGPGAGAAVTAAGVLNDLLRLAAERGVQRAKVVRPATAQRPYPIHTEL